MRACFELPDTGPTYERGAWHTVFEASQLLYVEAGCKPHPAETAPLRDFSPSVSSEPEATSLPLCSPTHTHTQICDYTVSLEGKSNLTAD